MNERELKMAELAEMNKAFDDFHKACQKAGKRKLSFAQGGWIFSIRFLRSALVFVFVLDDFDQSILVVFILVLCAVAPLLQLLQGDLKFPLGLDQILFVVLFTRDLWNLIDR